MTNAGAAQAAGVAPAQGYGKAIIGTLVQPFSGALSIVVLALVGAHVGHDLGPALDGAITTLVETPITLAAILLTPHNLFSQGT